MLRQKWGSVICPGCNNLVGVRDERCLTCGRWNPGLWGFGPALTKLGRDLGFAPFVITVCCALYAVTLLLSRRPSFNNLLSPDNAPLFMIGMSGAVPVFEYGRWWTVFTAGWLHGNILHIFFNMMSIRNIAPEVAELYGASRMAIIYIVSSAVGFTVSSLMGQYGLPIWPLYGADYTLGASAGITGLIGAILFYGRRTGSRHINNWAISSIIVFLVMGLSFRIIDNWAHVGGLAGGYVCAKILDPLHPERMDHLLIAVGLILVTIAAFVASILHALPLL